MLRVTPEQVGLSSQRLQRITPVMQRYVDEQKLAGVTTAIARHGQIAHFECLGWADLEAARPLQPDTIYRIYSMTKPITSVAVMMLYEEGHFQLNDPVSRFIPAFRDVKVFAGMSGDQMQLADLERPITIRDLLLHTAGLSYEFIDDSPVDALYREANLRPPETPLETFVEKLTRLPLVTQPGRAWRYSVATDVLGYLVEVIADTSFDVFLQERIFAPLGMTDTAFHVPPEKQDRFAAMYEPGKRGQLQTLDSPTQGRFSRPPRFLSGGGGLVSTVKDYLRFAQMLLDGGQFNGVRLLSRKTVELMTMNHLPADLMPIHVTPDAVMYGYGWGLGFRVLLNVAEAGILGSAGEYGWAGAAGTYFWIDPQEKLIGLLMIQHMPGSLYPTRHEFRTLAYQAIID